MREAFNPPNEEERKAMHSYSEARIMPFVERFNTVFSLMNLEFNRAISASFYALSWWIDSDKLAKEHFKEDLVSLMTRFLASYEDYESLDVEEFSRKMQQVSVALSILGKEDQMSSHEIMYSLLLSISAMRQDAVGKPQKVLDDHLEWLTYLGSSLLRQIMANTLGAAEQWPFGKPETIPFRML